MPYAAYPPRNASDQPPGAYCSPRVRSAGEARVRVAALRERFDLEAVIFTQGEAGTTACTDSGWVDGAASVTPSRENAEVCVAAFACWKLGATPVNVGAGVTVVVWLKRTNVEKRMASEKLKTSCNRSRYNALSTLATISYSVIVSHFLSVLCTS